MGMTAEQTQFTYKQELDFIEEIIQRLMEAYVDPSNQSAWFVANSNGKDSSCVSYCVWRAVERTPVEQRWRSVYFATTDTLLEHPDMKTLMNFSYVHMNEVAKETGLPIQAFLVKPKMTAIMKMIAHGNPLPTPKSKMNRWCTDWLKLRPMQELQDQLIAKHGSIVLMLGTRSEESRKRALSIKKHSVEGEFIFPKVGEKPNKNGQITKYMCHPIVHLSEEEVWRCITHARILPWKTKATTIRKMYEGAGECPIQVDKAVSKPCGSSSRNGCMICMMTTSKDDKMLQSFIDKGEEWAVHMNRLRRLIQDSLFDARFRRPINSFRKKHLDWANPFVHDYNELEDSWSEAKGKVETKRAFEREHRESWKQFDGVHKPLIDGTSPVYPNLSLAGYTLQARIFLLKAFLYTQEITGIELISEEEMAYIKKVWSDDFGWVENQEDLTPEFPEYKGSLVLNPDYSVNVEETTIENLTVYANVVDEETGYGMIAPWVENKKLHAPPRKRNRITKPEEIAQLNRPTPKTININVRNPERNEVFYVITDWGYTEEEIIKQLESSSLKTGKFIPYYWLPAVNIEKEFNWETFEQQDKMVYWNNVIFIVCDPSITTMQQAVAYVDWYMEQGHLPPVPKTRDWIAENDERYQGLNPYEAKIEMIRNAEAPELLSDRIKRYANVTDEELMISRVMRYFGTNEKMLEEYIGSEAWESVGQILIEGMKSYEAKHFLLERGYLPHVLPNQIKVYAGVGDKNLLKANTLRIRKGVTGDVMWKEFHLAYLLEGMSPEELHVFLAKNNYEESDIPKLVRQHLNISMKAITFAKRLIGAGMSAEGVLRLMDAVNQKQNHDEEEHKRGSCEQLELELGA